MSANTKSIVLFLALAVGAAAGWFAAGIWGPETGRTGGEAQAQPRPVR